MRLILLFLLLFVVKTTFSQPKLQLQQVASGLSYPVDITNCGDKRLFIVEQRGRIRIIDSMGVLLSTPFMDIDPRVNSSGNEQGLLGLAFPPDYAQTGYFYVNYIQNNGDTRISRFSVSANNPNVADPDSEVALLDIDQPYSNHNGGCIKFGPDGYLYIGTGDGGSGGDPQGNGQNKTTFLGKMLRIDVNEPNPPYYSIPDDNPFVNQPDYYPEIWAMGMRNPWRFSFDRNTGDMWIADVGQNQWEEIHFEAAGSGGHNYGWRCYEAEATYNTSGCGAESNYVFPIFKYSHTSANGCSVTGGFVYRGSQYPDLYGNYLFADYCSGRWWMTTPDGQGNYNTAVLANLSAYEYTSFGENMDGELYVTAWSTGKIFKVTDVCSGFKVTASIDSITCAGVSDGAIQLTTVGGQPPLTYTWNTGATASNLTELPADTYIVQVRDANQCIRRDTFELSDAPAYTMTIAYADGQLSSDLSLPGADYQWFLGNMAIPEATDSIYQPTETGVYSLQVVTAEGCVVISNTVDVTVSGTQLPVSVWSAKVQPNPAEGQFTAKVQLYQSEQSIMYLCDVTGKVLQEQSVEGQVLKATFDLSGYGSGAYWVLLPLQHGTLIRRVVKP